MPRKPTGNPRGRPKGSGLILGEQQTRLTVRIPQALYEALEELAGTQHFTRGEPELAGTVREALSHYLTCTHNRQTGNVLSHGEVSISRQTAKDPGNNNRQTKKKAPDIPSPPREGENCLPANEQPENIRQTENKPGDGANIRQTQNGVPGFDPAKYALGKLCPHGHDYHGTGQTLRRLPKYICPACDAERARHKHQAKRSAASGGTRA